MRVKVRLDGHRLRRWHVLLLERLASRPGLEVEVDPVLGQIAPPPSIESLFQLETLIHGLSRSGPAQLVPHSALAPFSRLTSAPADLTLDLCGDEHAGKGRVWRLIFDGVAGEMALLALILDGRTPLAEVVEGNVVVAAGRLGTEYGGIAVASFEDILARVSTLIVAALAGAASPALPLLPPGARPSQTLFRLSSARLPTLAAEQVARKVARKLYHLCYNAPHWRIGWRRLEGAGDLIDLRRHPDEGWHDLPDDGRRFYADPFPIVREGRVTLFVEDYEHRLGKGVISAVAFGPDGPIGRPEPVLEQPGHLSYPFVFEREGQYWMVPESYTAGTVDLYRATAFPGGWVKEATLLSGIAASDATLVEHGGCWWLFATVREGGGAFSDALHLWSAPDFRGPWTPHPRNPVLIDIASARPAGRMVQRDGILLRPVQDCRGGYGAALGIARVLRLDAEAFEQTVETILTPGPQWQGRRLHTLNSAGGLEFIDGSALSPRWVKGAAA
ncbi:hypothetical protein SAMN05216304_102992 [Bosea sp. OK403]|nr:formyl transferase [Bosea sp. OK403]SFI49081.1 hypothetical protein SAMN05216304_102992 [Bosea sp. OK403]